MNKYFLLANITLLLQVFSIHAKDAVIPSLEIIETEAYDTMSEPGAVMFTPPRDWRYADQTQLRKSVKVMVVGTSTSHFPPSINLATEPFKGTLKDYLKIIKKYNDDDGATWKDLGTIKTAAGNASLSQVDWKSKWGEVRDMHVILKRKDTIYILTAASLREDFSKYYKDFFSAMKSLKINKEFEEMVSSVSLREELLKKISALKIAAQGHPFPSEDFQKEQWIPFQTFLNERFSMMGKKWNNYVEQKVKSELTH